MKIKTIIKTSENKNYTSWIIEKFPENYKDLNYIEPFVGSGNVFLNKEPSVEEVMNDVDEKIVNIWRSLRDEHKLFSSKIKKLTYSEEIFNKYQNKKDPDYLGTGLNEFILRQMSKSGLKKTFLPKDKNTKCKDCWKELIDSINVIHERIKNCFILNKNAIEIISSFSNQKSLIYCDPPISEDGGMTINNHMELGELLNQFKGKAVILGPNTSLYKRIYKGWNRKGAPGSQKESLWLNF